MKKLTNKQIQSQLRLVSGWRIERGRLHKDFKFHDFKIAFDFMKQVAIVAGRLDHHPDWSNSYNKVSIRLFTHSANGITDNDFVLARTADKAAEKLQ